MPDQAFGNILAAAIAIADASRPAKPAKKRRKPSGPRVTFYGFLDAVEAQHQVKRVNTPGGFRIETLYDGYTPHAGDPLYLSYTYATRRLTVTRKPRDGEPEKTVRISQAVGVQVVAELGRAVVETLPYEQPDSCQCPFIATPPCSWCETAEWCDDCGEAIDPDLWENHLGKHEKGMIGNA